MKSSKLDWLVIISFITLTIIMIYGKQKTINFFESGNTYEGVKIIIERPIDENGLLNFDK